MPRNGIPGICGLNTFKKLPGFSAAAAPFCILICSIFSCSTFWPAPGILGLFHLGILVIVLDYPIVVLMYISLNDQWCCTSFLCLFATLIYPLLLEHLSIQISFLCNPLSIVLLKSSVCIWIQVLHWICILQIFFLICGLSFYFLSSVFWRAD